MSNIPAEMAVASSHSLRADAVKENVMVGNTRLPDARWGEKTPTEVAQTAVAAGSSGRKSSLVEVMVERWERRLAEEREATVVAAALCTPRRLYDYRDLTPRMSGEKV